MATITPTIGRKIYYWASLTTLQSVDATVRDSEQPMDATIVYVDKETETISVMVFDHHGMSFEDLDIRIAEHGAGDHLQGHDGEQSYCTWMPYQLGQAAAQQTKV